MTQRKSFLLRIDAQLYETLRKWADQEMRSVNGQIEYVLRSAIAHRTGHVLPVERQGNELTARDREDESEA